MTTDDEAGRYEIRVKGHLASRWAAWFDGMSLTNESDGTTSIRGPGTPQAALHGPLPRLRHTLPPLTGARPGAAALPGRRPPLPAHVRVGPDPRAVPARAGAGRLHPGRRRR